ARIHLANFLQLGGEVHFLHQVQVVVAAGRAVGAEADSDAGGTFFDYWGDAAGQHHVAGWIVHAANVIFGEELAVGFINPNTMGGDDIWAEQADALHVLNGSSVVLREAVVELFLDFRDMNQDGRVIFVGERLHVMKSLLGAEIDGVGRNGGVNQRITLPTLQECFGVGGGFRFILIVGNREVEPAFAYDGAHSGGFGFFGEGILEIVHVHESSDSAANHFGGGQTRAPADEV